MFNWSDNITLPNIMDVINISDTPPNVLQTFTYAWVWFLGPWFFAGVIGVLAGALYIKMENAMVPVTFVMVMSILFGAVLEQSPGGGLPSAEGFVAIIGLLAAFAVGFAFVR